MGLSYPARASLVEQALEWLRLEPCRDRRVGARPNGARKRIGPRLLTLDEPSMGLAPMIVQVTVDSGIAKAADPRR